MDYNKKLKSLIEVAEKDGYKFENGQFIKKIETKDICVMHISINSLGCGESLYQFELIDMMLQINVGQLKEVEKLTTKEEFLNWFFEQRLELVESRVLEYLCEEDIFFFEKDYEVSNYEPYLLANFETKYGDAGFIHIFKCPIEIFESHKQVCIKTSGSYLYE